jgi:hypothetical protein
VEVGTGRSNAEHAKPAEHDRYGTRETPFSYKWVQLFEFAPDDRIQRFHEFLDTQVLVSAFAAST